MNSLVTPDLDKVITPTSDESTLGGRSRVGLYYTARERGWCPRNSVAADHMCTKELGIP